jgi:hypothetical protein
VKLFCALIIEAAKSATVAETRRNTPLEHRAVTPRRHIPDRHSNARRRGMLDVKLGGAKTFENLTVFPLIAADADDLPYDLLADAIAAGTLTITEVGQGTVPTLVATNTGERPVLVLDGEQLIGSRQNRMTNRSILLPADSKTEIPVFCMEERRWHFTSGQMSAAPQHSPAKLRRHARVAEARRADAGMAAAPEVLREEQGAYWHDVADTLSALGSHSATGSLHAAYDAHLRRIAEFVATFDSRPDQVGLLAFAGDSALGLDIVGAPRLYARVHERLLRGYVLDALELASVRRSVGAAVPDGTAAQRYLDEVRQAPRRAAPTTGLGTYQVLSGVVIGGELFDDSRRVTHLSAFPSDRRGQDAGPIASDPNVAPPSQRRRHRRQPPDVI